MIRKTSLMAMLILVIMTSSVFAMIPETMDTQTAERRSMETLLINSTNGTRYELFLISDNARYISDDPLYKKVYGRDALKDDYIQEGDFYVYIARLGGETAFLQKNIGPFSTLDTAGRSKNGCYVIPGQNGMPDILERATSRIMCGSDTSYAAQFYVIKDNRLQGIQFMRQDRRIESSSKLWGWIYGDDAVKYLDDGTFYIQWYENVWPRVGSYKAVYMFDYQNLIMIEAYTYKKGLHDDDYHRI